jgi:SAM-dependent methyltransferase
MPRFGGEFDIRPDNRRLSALEALCDPVSTTTLTRVGLSPDWHCLEIGAGRGSIARWLAGQCPYGSVTATDTDIHHIADLRIPNLRVRQHDIVDGPDMPDGSFDLAHVRALLVHLPDRHAVLRRVLSWLAPGGWLVVEEPVLLPTPGRRDSSLRRALAGFERLMADRLGSDFRWPRQLSAALSTAGFVEVRTTTVPVVTSACNEFWRINLTTLEPDLVESGLVDQKTLARALATLDDPDHVDVIMALVCASCRRLSTKELTRSVLHLEPGGNAHGRPDYNHSR